MLRSTKIWVQDGIIALKIALDRMMSSILVVSTEVVGSSLLMFYAICGANAYKKVYLQGG
jgi:hypothetical protein